MGLSIGLDLGGTKINLTAYDGSNFLIPEMIEIPSRATDGPDACLAELVRAFELALVEAKVSRDDVTAVGLDTPGPASALGVFGEEGPTNFRDGWSHYDVRGALESRLGLPVKYLNDGNSAALYAHWKEFGDAKDKISVSLIIGTGLGGGIVTNGQILVGKVGFAAELGHVSLPVDWSKGDNIVAHCNCGKISDLESVASLTGIGKNLLPHYLPQFPGHPLGAIGDLKEAAKKVRGLAMQGDPMCRLIFETQTWALAAHIDQMINVFDPHTVFIGGGGVEVKMGEADSSDQLAFLEWFMGSIRRHIPFRPEQRDLAIRLIPDGDMAGARGSAIYALA